MCGYRVVMDVVRMRCIEGLSNIFILLVVNRGSIIIGYYFKFFFLRYVCMLKI